jgi:hypothetical protein
LMMAWIREERTELANPDLVQGPEKLVAKA